MNPMKKLFCGLLAVVLFCTMVTWPAKPAEAAVENKNFSTFTELVTYIAFAKEGDTLNLRYTGTDDLLFPASITIGKPIIINFETASGGVVRFRPTEANEYGKMFNIKSKDVHLTFSNTSISSGQTFRHEYGTAIYIDADNVTIKGADFNDCNSGRGGAIYINGRNVEIAECRFNNCRTSSYGGAIYVNEVNASITNCEFRGTQCYSDGGAVYLNKRDGKVIGCKFIDCRASEDGGAIFVDSSYCIIKDCEFDNCRVGGNYWWMGDQDKDGGAIKLTWRAGVGPLRVENCRFKDCYSRRYGHFVDGGNDTTIVHCTQPYSERNYYACRTGFSAIPYCTQNDLIEVVGLEPTCTSPGWKSYYACWCGLSFKEPIPNLRTVLPYQSDLEYWKKTPGQGYIPAKGHKFEYTTSENTVTAQCKNDPEHKVSLTLAVKDSIYGDGTKNFEITGNINHADWKKYGLDYELQFFNDRREPLSPLDKVPVERGTYYVRLVMEIPGSSAYIPLGHIEKKFTISPEPLKEWKVSLSNYSFKYEEGVERRVTVTVNAGDFFDRKRLVEDKDYIITPDSVTKATKEGTYYVTVKGIGYYGGEVKKEWKIVPQDPLKIHPLDTLTADPITYGDTLGKSIINPCPVFSGIDRVYGEFEWVDPDIKPEVRDSGKSYPVIFTPNTEADIKKYGILVTDVEVTVNPKDLSGISKDNITTPDTYTGDDLKDYIKVDLDGLPGLDLEKGKDYDVIAPTRVVEPGAYTAEIKFKGNYTGSTTKNFTIKREVGAEDIDLTVPAYTGEVLNDSIIVWLDRKEIKKGTDYEIRFSPAEVKERGKYTAYITLKGDYIKGNVEVIFSVDGEERKPRPAPSPTPTPSPSPSPSPSPYPDDGEGYSGGGYSGGGSSGGSLSRPPVTTQTPVIKDDQSSQDTKEEPSTEIDILEMLYAHPDAGKALPLIRMYNPVSGEHIMTTDINEADTLEAKHGWKREAMTGTSSKANDSPVFRLVHPATGKHIYSMNENEVRVLTTEQGWESDGIVFFAGGSNVKMYRLYNPSLPAAIAHHYTTDEVEYNTLQSQGWTGEGVAFTLD